MTSCTQASLLQCAGATIRHRHACFPWGADGIEYRADTGDAGYRILRAFPYLDDTVPYGDAWEWRIWIIPPADEETLTLATLIAVETQPPQYTSEFTLTPSMREAYRERTDGLLWGCDELMMLEGIQLLLLSPPLVTADGKKVEAADICLKDYPFLFLRKGREEDRMRS